MTSKRASPRSFVSREGSHRRSIGDWPRAFEALRGERRDDVTGFGNVFVAIMEVDRFAALRQAVGPSISNRVITTLVERILMTLEDCVIGRAGRTGIEFAFRQASREAAGAALAALVRVLEQRIDVDGFDFDLPVTIGVSEGAGEPLGEALLDGAAVAVARAQQRHAKIGWADPSAIDAEFEDLALVRELRQAVRTQQLFLVHQPKLRTRTNQIDSIEALLRWDHPVHGRVPIERLIKLAEGSGAIRELSDWVLAQAVSEQARFAAAGHDLVVYVNISGVLLPDAEFARRSLAILGDSATRIGFEITETAVIDDPEGALRNLHIFHDAGVRIAIDDYGSGLSSLTYLKQLPAQELKIDRLFVQGLTSTNRDPLLVRSSIDLAHALEMQVTAEGVDDPMALSLLQVMGCDLIQGYLIAPPLRVAELIGFLDGWDHTVDQGADRKELARMAGTDRC